MTSFTPQPGRHPCVNMELMRPIRHSSCMTAGYSKLCVRHEHEACKKAVEVCFLIVSIVSRYKQHALGLESQQSQQSMGVVSKHILMVSIWFSATINIKLKSRIAS